ncbi:MAG TPA: tryptophan--tRNA ligase [Bacillales bacterium]|nr:tryptophan--tRNA ligase [Bacillales bacterium]
MNKKVTLTGIKPTGNIHIGNYIGVIKPALALAKHHEYDPVYFIADYHGLTSVHDPNRFRELTYGVAATWLALGLDPEKVTFYRQSDVPDIFELCWILACLTPKGLMNRAHAYKAKVEQNQSAGLDADNDVNMGLFSYPILMAADILLFQSDIVPVGKDQIQHVEIARDIAEHFNKMFGFTFKLPEYRVDEETAVIPGLDGRKMSKSYNNTIPLFSSEAELRKRIFQIKTDSLRPEEPKNPETSTLFLIYKEFANEKQVQDMRKRYQRGIGWGEVKQELYELMNAYLAEPRKKFKCLMENPGEIDAILVEGAQKARERCRPFSEEVRRKIGLKS